MPRPAEYDKKIYDTLSPASSTGLCSRAGADPVTSKYTAPETYASDAARAVLHDPTPDIITGSGEQAVMRFHEFFGAFLLNINTRTAYRRAIERFLAWCEGRGLRHLDQIEPRLVATYVEQHSGARPTVKQHLAAIRMLFDWLAARQVIRFNPASSVRGPRHVVTRRKAPLLTPAQARQFLDDIDTDTVVGARDRAVLGIMLYTFARVGAVVGLRVADYAAHREGYRFRFRRLGGRFHEVPAHPKAVAYVDAYLEAAGLRGEHDKPLFRTVDRHGRLTQASLTRTDVLRMIKRRARAQGLSRRISCRTFRATGLAAYLENGGTLEEAQAIAGHATLRSTRLYARAAREITPAEIERIVI
ncbi:MAG: tyrosine-type recombinase/integrase [Gammaproteobacteria bacterium]|nr:tyrosine-type recombinase/integrase [Gammaproteobacteria bacterium]NIR85285.1 tyrosine-type recombinase/integrase [Gammaproteobacteria bacterium]NIR88401.1 tyrosine-type recombinase/integrase [Gammaproteobacteria bacterium]NIU06351.1 tyrosine-type recombinase/integrase [Gammaproteobacteria bacterium]NIV53250.1 tyrosine-type recombinase/integrase [Gammaproteobacteria bacterium]